MDFRSHLSLSLSCALAAQEGFTNVETAAHGLECVEKLLLFREVTLVRWKKWMELEHGDASRAQHFLTREDAEARKDDAELRKRVSMEAQVLTHALLEQVSGSSQSARRLRKSGAAGLFRIIVLRLRR